MSAQHIAAARDEWRGSAGLQMKPGTIGLPALMELGCCYSDRSPACLSRLPGRNHPLISARSNCYHARVTAVQCFLRAGGEPDCQLIICPVPGAYQLRRDQLASLGCNNNVEWRGFLDTSPSVMALDFAGLVSGAGSVPGAETTVAGCAGWTAGSSALQRALPLLHVMHWGLAV